VVATPMLVKKFPLPLRRFIGDPSNSRLQEAHSEIVRVARATPLGELAASIAHEINQPLGAIVNNGNACLRLLRTKSWSEVREAIAAIVEDANRASGIIARTRAMFNRSAPAKMQLQLQDVVTDALRLAQGDLAENRIIVLTHLGNDLPSVSGDRIQFQEVLLNLMRNAIEAMSQVPDERRVLRLGCQESELNGKPAVLLTVQDRGGGFSPEEAGRVFDAFYTTKPTGMGMGLRSCLSIAEAHGGRLTASLNSDGPGATFRFLLPAVGQHRKRSNHEPN